MDKIKWLFFDIGSTLVDESECLKERFNFITRENRINEQKFADKVLEYAKTDCYAIQSAAGYFSVKIIPEWNKDLEQLYPHVELILNTLSQKYKLGVIANQSFGTKDRLNNWGIGKYFEVVISSAEEGCAKPDLKIFNFALESADCNPGDAVMIGDRLDNDIIPAKKIGMKTVWVRQGFAKYMNPKSEIDKPDHTIQSIDELVGLLVKNATFEKLRRIDERDYPEVAVREALLNSLVHRDYSFSASTLISVYADRIEFITIGGLPTGVSLDDVMLGLSVCLLVQRGQGKNTHYTLPD